MEQQVDVGKVVAVLQRDFPKEWALAFQQVLIEQLTEQNDQLQQALAATNGDGARVPAQT